MMADANALCFNLLGQVDALREGASQKLTQSRRGEMGQFLTPASVAQLMASLLTYAGPEVSLVDAGAGVGSLFAASVAALCARPEPPRHIHVVAYEIEPALAAGARKALHLCRFLCERAGVLFAGEVREADFLQEAARLLSTDLLTPKLQLNAPPFNCAILNPPYRKINAGSEARLHLRSMGIETSNLYAGFLAAVVKMLAPGGELVAITPRSFCNGRYFRPFRQEFLHTMALRRLHLFESRQETFKQDAVLQETVILHAVKGAPEPETLVVTSGGHAEDEFFWRKVRYSEVVRPDDSERFIRILSDETGRHVTERMARFDTSLDALGLSVSTGRVVDFRAAQYLRQEPKTGDAPLIYPLHLQNGSVSWPKQGAKKPNALAVVQKTRSLLVPNGHYVLVKRFSAKEQAKRLTAAVYDAQRVPAADGPGVGFENHLNYFHSGGKGMDLTLARGLTVFLNATLVDEFFRLLSGHTQVNATDLRSLKYPSRSQLRALGAQVGTNFPNQDEIDLLVQKELRNMANEAAAADQGPDPVATKKRVNEAMEVLATLGLPRAQQNERSALTLLALLDLKPSQTWAEATNPLLGITPIMDFAAAQYGKTYAPNSRETFRRFSVHQFVEAGLLVANPDEPGRPVNSPNNVYQVEASALNLLRTFGTVEWEPGLVAYLATVETLKTRYAQEREMKRIPVTVAPGKTIMLSPGGQNVLVEKIISDFAAHFTPGGKLLYMGDTDEKFAYFDQAALAALGIEMEAHGKMPDVIVHHVEKEWLVLIEAVTSHGPVNAKRQAELKQLFANSTAGLVFVTAFLTRKAFMAYLPEIAWETEVWIAESPTHLIHFNGERFLGPY